jgi:hypothetical protein
VYSSRASGSTDVARHTPRGDGCQAIQDDGRPTRFIRGILEIFQTAAVAAGLRCHRLGPPLLDGWNNPGVQCKPNADRNLGLVDAIDVRESKSVVISAFSSNVSTPHGELDPPVETALIGFRRIAWGQPESPADR